MFAPVVLKGSCRLREQGDIPYESIFFTAQYLQ